MLFVWMVLVAARLIYAPLQTGYIHPDEFFQTVEIVAGDAFNISVLRTWEFDPSHPIRSVFLPQLLFLPIFKTMEVFCRLYPGINISGYHLLASARFIMAVFSISIDICVYKIIIQMKVSGLVALVLLSSSCVMLTYQVHTFTNSFENLLTIVLFTIIVKLTRKDFESLNDDADMTSFVNDADKSRVITSRKLNHTNETDIEGDNNITVKENKELSQSGCILRKRKMDTEKTLQGQENLDKNVRKCMKLEPSYRLCFVVGVVHTLGIFNRPTFVLLSTLPLIWWFSYFYHSIQVAIKRILVLAIVTLGTSFLLCVFDSMYYQGIHFKELMTSDGLERLFSKFTITPFNFIMYNTAFSNLESHGRHPFFLHVVVNMPMLYGPLLFYFILHLFREIARVIKSCQNCFGREEFIADKCSFSQSLRKSLLCFILFPLLCLSCFPHQEARFLVPLLPFVVLNAVNVSRKFSKHFWMIYAIFNLTLCLIFGCFHQGGVTPCLINLQMSQLSTNTSDFSLQTNGSSYYIIFSHTYMPPRHLLLNKNPNLHVIDLKGNNLDHVEDTLVDLLKSKHTKINVFGSDKIYFVLPGTLVREFISNHAKNISFTLVDKFFPHVSFEGLPTFEQILDINNTFKALFSLHLFEIA